MKANNQWQNPPKPTSNLDVAKALAEQGFHVFPCQEDGETPKRPCRGVYWRHQSSTDPRKLEAWWEKWPGALPAIDLGKSGHVVIDADRHGGPDGVSAWKKLTADRAVSAPTVETPGGGLHFYFRQPDGEPLGNKEGDLPPGINVRGCGGYVIAPGAMMPDGRCYAGGLDLSAAQQAPRWLADLIRSKGSEQAQGSAKVEPIRLRPTTNSPSPHYLNKAIGDELSQLANAGKGTSNNTLNEVSFALGTMAGSGWISRAQAFGWLEQTAWANDAIRKDGRAQMLSTIRSGLESGMKSPRPMPEEQDRDDAAGAAIAAALVASETEMPDTSASIKNELFEVVHINDVQLSTRPRYLIKHVMPDQGLAIVWGPPKQGKSFIVCDMALHVATGREYRGKRVKQGIVVYCVLEGQFGFQARAAAIRQQRLEDVDLADAPFYVVSASMELVKDNQKLVRSIQAKLGDETPAMVVIDTLNRSYTGSESDDKDMAAYIKAADVVVKAFNCLVPIVHHCGHDQSRMRGWSGLLGALDAELSVKKDENGLIHARVECMKDGPDGAEFWSELEQVVVGKDDDGDDITSCVVREADAPEAEAAPKGSRKKLDGAQKIAYDALEYLVKTEGSNVLYQPEIPPDVLCVDEDKWRDLAISRGISKGIDPSAKRQAFRFAKKGLIQNGWVQAFESRVWIIPMPSETAFFTVGNSLSKVELSGVFATQSGREKREKP